MSYKKFEDLFPTEKIEIKQHIYKLYGYLLEDPNISNTVIIIKKQDTMILNDIKNLIDQINNIKSNMVDTYLFGDIYINIDEIVKIQEILILLENIVSIDENKISIITYNKIKSFFDISHI